MSDRVVSYSFRGSFTNLNAGLAAAGRNVTELGTKLTALDKNGVKTRAGLTTLGGAAGKVGLVAAAGLGAAVFAAARFDKAMSAVQAATHETADNMELLRNAAIKAGADTVYSASEAAGAIEELAKAGVSTKDILAGGLSGALNLAAAGAIDVSDAAAIAATAMTQFKLSGDQVNHVADLLAAGAGKAQGGVDDLGMALKQSGLVASQFGLSVDDTVGSLTAFASAGLLGSDAGTSFKQLLLSLANPSNKAAAEMQNLGIQAYDAQGKFVGITNLAGQLQEALKGQTQATRDSALATIFGSDAIRAANVLYTDGADGIQGWIDKTNDAGYAATTAATRLDNLSGDLEQLKGSLETALIGAGEGSQGPLRGLVQHTTELVNALNSIPAPAKSAATGLLAITAVTGGALWFGSKVINGIASAKAALTALGITAETTRTKLALVGTGGAAAALGVGTLIDTLGRMDSMSRSGAAADATVKSFQDLSDALQYSNVGKYADDLHINLGRLTQDLADNGESGEYVQRVMEQLSGTQHGFGAAIKAFAGEDLPFYTGSTLKSGYALDDLNSIIDEGSDVLGKSSTATTEAAGATTTFGTRARTAAQQTSLLNDEIRKSREAAKGTAQAFVGLGKSLSDGKVSLGDWIKQLQHQADALRNFRVNAETAANKGLRQGLIKALQEAGPEGALRMKQLANATKDEIAKANGAWQSGQKQVKLYTDAIGGVPTKVETKVKTDTFDAMAAVARLKNSLAQIKSKDVTIALHYTGFQNKLAAMAGAGVGVPQAEGGTVPGQRSPYGDKTLIFAAPGEEIITNRNGEADRFRSDRAMGRIPAYANGGTIGQVGSATFASANPFYGLGHAAHDAGISLNGFSKIGLKELKQRDHILERQQKQAEKEVQASEDRLTEMRDQLKAMKDARQQFADSVKSNFMTSLFGKNTDLAAQIQAGALSGGATSALGNSVYLFAQQQQAADAAKAKANGQPPPDVTAFNFDDWIQRYLDSLTNAQRTALQVQANTGQLHQDASNANTFANLLRQLRHDGLRGAAYRELAQSGNLDQAQAYANLSPRSIRQLVEDYRNRQTAVNRLGKQVGDAEFGRQINRQTRAVERQTELVRENRDHLKEIERLDKLIEQRLQKIEKHTRDNAKDTGDAVTKGLNGASSAAQRSPK